MEKQSVILSSLFLMLSIVLGAFGAHALKAILTEDLLQTFEVGVRYQSFLALSTLVLSLQADRFNFSVKRITQAMLVGLFLFSFSIYGIVALKHLGLSVGILGPITPIGGAISIISWCVFIFRLLKY
ncbi:MAG: DUF423 domain-containing protein [Flavobacteriales bacterium]